MDILEIKERNSNLINELLDIWEDSVRATHHFLKDSDINKIKEYVPNLLLNVKNLIVIKNSFKQMVGFMGIDFQMLQMLFIKNSERNKGYGTKLLKYGIKKYHIKKLSVNEDNPDALKFYESFGFKTYLRSDLDEEGNPYPILYMKLDS